MFCFFLFPFLPFAPRTEPAPNPQKPNLEVRVQVCQKGPNPHRTEPRTACE